MSTHPKTEILRELGVESFTIDEDKFRIVQAIDKKFQWRWKDKKLSEYTAEEVKKANLRTICVDELVLDYEDKESARKGKAKLEKEGFKYEAWMSGSRGAHFHTKLAGMEKFPEKVRNYIRKQLILYFEADVTKAAEGTLIAVAGKPHWKTGRIKTHAVGEININPLPDYIKTELPKDEDTIKDDVSEGPKAVKEPCPACKEVLEKGVGEGGRNNMRTNVVLYYYKERGLSKKETIEKVLEWNSKCSPPEDKDQVVKTTMNTMDHAEYNVGCQSWKDTCPFVNKDGDIEKHKCAWIKRYKGWLEDLAYEGIPIAQEEPEDAFENPIDKDNLISRWISHMQKRTDAYPEYHLGAMLTLLSIITKRRAAIQVNPKPIFPSIWMMLIGDSTISRKSTSVNAIKDMGIRINLADHLCPDDFTPESLVKVLQVKGQRIFIQEEFEEFFGQMSKDYKAGLAGTLCKLYENEQTFQRELMSRSYFVQNVFLPILTATTIETFKGNRGVDTHIKNGFFARFLYMFPKRKKTIKDMSPVTLEEQSEYEELKSWLEALSKIFDDIDEASPEKVFFSKEALSFFNNWQKKMETSSLTGSISDNQLRFYGRLYPSVVKIAFLHHIGRPEYRPILSGGLQLVKQISYIYHKGIGEKTPTNQLNSPQNPTTVSSELVSYNETNQSLNSNVNNNNNSISSISTNTDSSPNPLISKLISENGTPFFTIGLDDVKIAIELAEMFFIPFSDRFLSEVQGIGTNTETVFNAIMSKYKKDKPVPHSVALRNSNLDAFDFKKAITTLVQSKRIRIIEKEKPKHSQHIPLLYVPLDPDGVLRIKRRKRK